MDETANQPTELTASNRLWRKPPFHNNPADMADAHSFTWHGTGQTLLEAKLLPASRSLCRRLVQQGIELWEYQPQMLHAKLIVVDDIVFVGSSNLDPRSLRINFEIMLRIQNAALAATARQQFESDLAQHALPITCDGLQQGRSWWERLKQRLAYWFFARLDSELAALKLQVWHVRKDRFVQRVKRVRRDGARRVE